MNSILAFLGGVGMQELLVIGLFILVFFGAKKIPDFMKGLGKGLREFKEGVKDVKKDFEDSHEASKVEEK
jgi:sec-independent protein translocase protein TatA